jgi:type IV pilus assembly protein PilM
MARSPFCWGIDVGKSALKAVRCRLGDEPRKLAADAFDYVEYPMLLTQPEADPVELVRDALREFLGRNSLKGDRVAVAVPGQSGLAKFIKLPPIEAKKIPDIVKYEARQQIPFPLDQVVWDWQRLAGGVEEGGFVLDAEVALFAMKRDQVFKALAPLAEAGIEIDVLQLAPIALANMVAFDQFSDPATVDPEQPPASIALVSMGVDATDLVVTNGLRIWQRSIPIGGSSFTKAIIQGMKLTFAKAEHLKRNVVRAEDPKTVFKVMRPVFNEFAAEVQRSLNYFTGTDRTATIGKLLLLGNATKLRGLSDFVGKQLGLEVQRFETFRGLEGAGVLGAPAFRENRLSFGTAYGLALQGAGGPGVRTNLLPREVIQERLIETKKPWALGAGVGLLGAAAISFIGMYFAWTTFAPSDFAAAFAQADGVKAKSAAAISAVDAAKQNRDAALAQQRVLVEVQDRRFQSLDMLRAVQALLPRDPPGVVPVNPADRNELHFTSVDCQFFPDLAAWFAAVRQQWTETHASDDGNGGAEEGLAADGGPAGELAPAADAPNPEGGPVSTPGPTGPGWVVQLVGHHYHNEDQHKPHEAAQFVRSTIVKGLLGEGDKVMVSAGPLAGQAVSPGDLGIGYPVIVSASPVKTVRVPKAGSAAPGEPIAPRPDPFPGDSGADQPDEHEFTLRRFDFKLQFVWQPVSPGAARPVVVARTPAPAAN